MSNVDLGLDTPVDDIKDNPVFAEFLRREKEAQDQAKPDAPAPGEAPAPAPGDAVEPKPAAEQEQTPTEGESPLAPDSSSTGTEAEATPPITTPPPSTLSEEVDAAGEGEVEEPTPLPAQEAPAVLLRYGGVDYSQDDVGRMVGVDNWVQGLRQQFDVQTPNGPYNPAIAAIDGLLSGQYKLVPASEQVPPMSGPFGVSAPSAPAQVAPPPGTGPTASVPEEDDLLDPALKARFDALESNISKVTTSLEAQQQAQLQAQQNSMVASLDTGRQQFQAEHNLSDAEAQGLIDRVVGLQVLPSYIQHHQGNYIAAMKHALEDNFWADPALRQKAMEQAATDATSTDTSKTRTRKVSALTGSGGSSPPRTDAPPPNSRDARRQGMVNAITNHQNGNQPS